MKTFLKITIAVLLVYFVTGCNDYLETSSDSTFTEETTFSNLDFAQKAVFGIYSNFSSVWSYDYTLGMYFPCDNDIESVIGNDDASKRSLCRYKGDDGNAYIKGPWDNMYQTIERANICIDNLPVSPIWEGEYANEARRLYGEAVTLRALMYYELVRNYGDVPFSLKSVQNGDQYTRPKTDRDEIYETLIEELKEVEPYMPWMKEIGTAERITKGFVKGLRARMALSYAGYSLRNKTFETRRGRNWEEYYRIAHQECKDIMESGRHQLNSNYVNIFKTIQSYHQDIQYGEVLFEIGFGRLYTGRVGQSIGMYFTTNPAEPQYGRAAAEIQTTPYYFYSFDNNDVRRNTTCELYNYGSSSQLGRQVILAYNHWRICKWRKSWIDPPMGGSLSGVYYTGVNWPLMRYSDIVLMFAETENEINGPTALAKEALASVRQRAFSSDLWGEKVTNYVDSVSVSKEDFFNAIVDERKWEFGGEMIRKYDLVRWNILGEKLEEVREENIKILNDDPQWANVPNFIFWKYDDDGTTLDILNQDYRLPSTSIPEYSRSSWLSGFSDNTKSKFITDINKIGDGFDKTKNNHLFPISASTILESEGLLSNDQIPQ